MDSSNAVFSLCGCAVATLLVACGGGGSNSGGPVSGPALEDIGNAELADVTASLDFSTNRVTLQWHDTFATASRYQVEERNEDGSWSAIDGVWATQAARRQVNTNVLPTLQWSGPVTTSTMFRAEAVLPGYTVPLRTGAAEQIVRIPVLPPSQLPAMVFDQSEPVQGSVGVCLSNSGSYTFVDYFVDGKALASSDTGTSYCTSLDMSSLTTSTHTIQARLQVDAASSLQLTRNVQVHTSAAAIGMNVVAGPSVVDVYVEATSDSNIQSVSVDTVFAASGNSSLGSLMAPNVCNPAPCMPGESFNSYHFSFDPRSAGAGGQMLLAAAIDAAGHTASAADTILLPSPTTVTLDSPVNGALVQGTLQISGTVASGTPGALETMVTLSGIPVDDTTVANPGTGVPFATNVSLVGVPSGIHTVDVYARVGSESYELVASAFVMVAGAQ